MPLSAEHSQQSPPAASATFIPWVPLLWCATLLIVTYLPILALMVRQWNNDDDMGHGFFVPLVALYVVWQMRDSLLAVKSNPSWFGLLFLIWGGLQMAVGMLGAELFLQRTAFLISLVGAVFFLGGWPMLRALRFPLAMLIFMVPIPAVIYNQITFPLQLLASRVAEVALTTVGIPVLRDGNVLELASQKLSVVEACSGIRSLLSLTFLSMVYGYFFEENRIELRWLLFFSTLPIAIAANSFRVSLTGLLSEYNPELAQGFFHSLEGWVIFVFALLLLVGCHRLLVWLSKRFGSSKVPA
jgi:exosortase